MRTPQLVSGDLAHLVFKEYTKEVRSVYKNHRHLTKPILTKNDYITNLNAYSMIVFNEVLQNEGYKIPAPKDVDVGLDHQVIAGIVLREKPKNRHHTSYKLHKYLQLCGQKFPIMVPIDNLKIIDAELTLEMVDKKRFEYYPQLSTKGMVPIIKQSNSLDANNIPKNFVKEGIHRLSISMKSEVSSLTYAGMLVYGGVNPLYISNEKSALYALKL